MPMQMPYLFEDPFITTSLNLVGVWNEYPSGSDTVFDGGHVWVAAAQARIALTDRLASIAAKDGYAFHRPGRNILPNGNGFVDISAGFKYALIQRKDKNFILSPMFRVDIPTGQKKVFSGNGSGVAMPAVAWAWGWRGFHTIGDVGARIPFDGDAESTSVFWNLHIDYVLHRFFVPFFEVGGMHWTDGGDGSLGIKTKTPLGTVPLSAAQALLGTGSFDGIDVVNLGSRGVAGNDIVMVSFGARFPIVRHVTFGASYDMPVTHREDLIKQRVNLSLLLEF